MNCCSHACREGRDCPSREARTDEWLVRCAMVAMTALFVVVSFLAEIFR
jgi:hypothetical protein